MSKNYPVIVILGPTASGKSRLGIDLATLFQGEIISCDALQIYKHMDIGTDKISQAEQCLIKHHLLDSRNPDEGFSAGDYQRLARKALNSIRNQGRLPFVVGGTGFYLRSLIEGLFDGPGRSEELRIRMRGIIERKGVKRLHRALQRIDAKSAARIAENDTARIIRAYEVYLVSNKPMSKWQSQPRNALRGYRWLKLGLDVSREVLYQRIDQRVEEMLQRGFIDEVRGLLESFPRECHAFRAIGYRQIAEYLEGKLTLQQAVEATKRESRRFAKRQLTWFRSDKSIVWLNGQLDIDDLRKQSAELVKEFLRMEQA